MDKNPKVPETIVEIISILHKTKALQKDVISVLNNHDPTLTEGAITLMLIAAGHLKDYEMTKEGFLTICDVIWAGSSSPSNDDDDDKPTMVN